MTENSRPVPYNPAGSYDFGAHLWGLGEPINSFGDNLLDEAFSLHVDRVTCRLGYERISAQFDYDCALWSAQQAGTCTCSSSLLLSGTSYCPVHPTPQET